MVLLSLKLVTPLKVKVIEYCGYTLWFQRMSSLLKSGGEVEKSIDARLDGFLNECFMHVVQKQYFLIMNVKKIIRSIIKPDYKQSAI